MLISYLTNDCTIFQTDISNSISFSNPIGKNYLQFPTTVTYTFPTNLIVTLGRFELPNTNAASIALDF